MDDLKHKIEIVLNEETRAYEANGRNRGGLGSFNINLQTGGWGEEGRTPNLVVETPSRDLIQSSNAQILLKLYSSLNPKNKKEFQEILIAYLSIASPYFKVAYLIFFILHRVGYTIETIKYARMNLRGDSNHSFSNMLAMLSQIVSHESSFLGKELLSQIKKSMEGEDEHNFELFARINNAELKILERELEDVNQEINQDREKIISLWQEKFGSDELVAVVNEIEEYFTGGDFTQTKFATCVDRVRALISEVARSIALDLSSKDSDQRVHKLIKEHQVFEYLKDQNFLDEKELVLLKAIYSMASDRGSHAISTLKEQARIIKNIAYEFILLLLNK